jgi:hypothetical protein
LWSKCAARHALETSQAKPWTAPILAGGSIWSSSKGFVYVGAAALALLALAVILMGLFANRNGRAEGLAVLGFFGYAAYLVAATAVLYVMSRKD